MVDVSGSSGTQNRMASASSDLSHHDIPSSNFLIIFGTRF
ncbi:hypothetical protein QN277_024596 [Acacia crassicarpa]|uniref:Uncharacterized protein n=1 Tax=Acacia crassicarpa TaxID=499986 RepID=A0AAE1JCJ3_9FABA|nr:hypothetical protein QN277_024596 [Acacia crassicarpa]